MRRRTAPAGTYTITNTVGTLSATNYNFNFVNGTLTVTQAVLTVSANSTNRLYGTTNPVFTVNYAGFSNNETAAVLSGAPSLTTGAKTNSPVGAYVITNTLGTLGAVNYSFNFVNGTLNVGAATLAVSANNTNRFYGATNPVFTASYSGFVNGDNAGVLSGSPSLTTSAKTNSPAGNYTITNTAGTLSATNYTFNFTNGLLAVNPAALTVTASNQSKTYGQTLAFAGTEFSASGLWNQDTVTGASLSSTGAAAGASVNGSPYNIVITNAAGTGLTNYSIGYVNGQLTVSAAALGVTANNTNRLYGAANPAFTVTYSGFLNGDTAGVLSGAPSLITGAKTNSPTGAYTITNTTGTLSATNYVFNFTNGTLTINPAALTVAANNTNRMYGLTNPVFTASYSGFVNGESSGVLAGFPSLTTPATSASPAGNYPINITQGTLSNNNYNFTFTNGVLAVTPAPAPVILSFGLSNRVVNVTWSSVAGATYGMQSNTNLMSTNWNNILPNVTATGTTTSQTNAVGSAPRLFYRIRLVTQ